MAIKCFINSGQITLKDSLKDKGQVFDNQTSLTAEAHASNASNLNIRVGTSANDADDIFVYVDIAYTKFTDEGGTALGASRNATVTALQAIFDSTLNLNTFVEGDTSAGNTGTTKLRHIKASSGTDRDAAGTLELDTHSASIGLYESFLKINEIDLSNTGGKTQALGQFTLDLQRLTGGSTNVMTIRMQQLVQGAQGDFNFHSLDISGAVTFSGSTSGIDYGDLSNTPTTIASLVADTTPQLGGDLDVNGQKIVSASNGDIVLDPNGTGKIILKSDDVRLEGADSSVQVGTVKLYEADLVGDNFVALKAPLTITSDVTFTLPAADGTSNQVLKTDGAGALGFATVVQTNNPAIAGTMTFSSITTFDPKIITNTNKPLRLDPNGSGDVIFMGNSTRGSGRLVLNCEQNSHGITLQGPPHSANATYTLTLPTSDGNANQVLKTDGSGALSWTNQSTGGSPTAYDYDAFTTSANVTINSGVSVASNKIVDIMGDALAAKNNANAKKFLGFHTGSGVCVLKGMVNANNSISGASAGSPLWLGASGGFIASAPSTANEYSRIVGYFVATLQGGQVMCYFDPSQDWIQIDS